MNQKHVFFFLILFFISHELIADVVGSETIVSLEAFKEFPENPILDNEIIGFAWMKNGFGFENANTACTFNALYPVSGTIDLNGGILTLDQDLKFHNDTILQSLGVIIGNNHTIDLCTSITSFPASSQEFNNTVINLTADLNITSTITFKGTCVFIF